MKTLSYSTLILFLVLFCSNSFSQTFNSTNQSTQLIELYTSEGCSSCPPADKWINKLKYDPQLWSKFIPVAFHVDYWDDIGWKDPFANAQFSDRQRQYAQQANLSSLYTPAILLNGREWTAWRKQSRLSLASTADNTGKLSLTLDNGQINARYQAIESQSSDLILNIAILGFDVKSEVNAGENSGHVFTHDFIVLGFQRVAMTLSEEGIYTAVLKKLPVLSQQTNNLAISSWVNTENSLTPLQATGGWIDRPAATLLR